MWISQGFFLLTLSLPFNFGSEESHWKMSLRIILTVDFQTGRLVFAI
jgi:hypothetical protein